jgi:hypothetical protein
VVCLCSFVNRHIHVWLIGGADDQCAIDDIISAKRSRPISDKALSREVHQGLGEVRADHHYVCLSLKQPLDFPRRNFPAADHQTAFAL